MSDSEFVDTQNGAASDAEKLIVQRIGELRAIALEGADPGGDETYDLSAHPSVRAVRAQAQELPPVLNATTPLSVAAVEPAPVELRPTPPPRKPKVGEAMTTPTLPATVAATLARMERSVADEVSRIESLLRSWGSPVAASNQLGDQVVSALQRVEHSLRKDLGRVIEAVHAAALDGGDSEVAISEWGARLEEAMTTQVGELRTGLLDLDLRIRETHEEVGRATSGMAAITGAGIGDKVAGAIDALRDPLLTGIDSVEQAAETLSSTVTTELTALRDELTTLLGRELSVLRSELPEEIGDVIAEFVEDVHTHVRSQGGAAVDAVRESTTQVTRSIDRSEHLLQSAIERLTLAVNEGADQLPAELQRQFAETIAQLQNRIEKHTTRQSVVTRQVGDDLTAHVTATSDALTLRIEESNTTISDQVAEHARTMGGQIEVLKAEGTRLFDRIEELEECLLAVHDDVPEALATKVVDSVATLRELLTEDSEIARESLIEVVDDLKLELSNELDTNRLQHVRDAEMIIDAMTTGWTAVLNRLQATDSRIASLENRIEEWFSLIDESAFDDAT